jgi:hypothetical protein
MLGCLIFKFSVTSNNLIGSFVLPHTPNGHVRRAASAQPPPAAGGRLAAAHAETAQCLPVAKALPLRLWPGLRRI